MLATQFKVAECETAASAPVPDRVIVAGELVALLATVTLPFTLAALAGVKLTLRLAVCPGVRICPVDTPLAANPAPAMVTFDTVTSEFPAFVNVTPKLRLLPTLTLEKFKLVVLPFKRDVAAPTVSVAALLVALPVLFVTVTVNLAPLSEVDAAAVVYDAEVAPLIAAPFFFHWYVRVAVPVAVTAKLAVCPAVTLLLAGCPVMDGATGAAVTVRTAGLLVTLPAASPTVTVNDAPSSEAVVAVVV